MLTPHIIDEEQKLVLAIGRYDLLLKTDHSLNIPKLEQLIGVPTCRVSVRLNYGLPNCLSILEEVAERPVSKAHPIYHLRDQEGDEDTYRAYVHGILTETLTHAKDDKHQTPLEKIDKVLTNPWLGFPIMMALLYFVFWCTFTLGAYPQEWIEMGVDALAEWLSNIWTDGGWLQSLCIDGILKGVGAVLAFLPNIIILFFFNRWRIRGFFDRCFIFG